MAPGKPLPTWLTLSAETGAAPAGRGTFSGDCAPGAVPSTVLPLDRPWRGWAGALLAVTDHAVTRWLISGEQADPFAWLASLTRRPEWHADAACRGHSPSTFVLGRGANAAVMYRARAICDRCTVSEQCLDFALADPDAVGIWGGTTAQVRRAMRAERVA